MPLVEIVMSVRSGLWMILFFLLHSRSQSVKSSEVRIRVRVRVRSQVIFCYFPRIISNNCRR